MTRTFLFCASMLILVCAGESVAQSDFVSSGETAALFSMGYATGSGSKSGNVSGGLTLTNWVDAQVFLGISDPGSYGRTLYELGLGVKPFTRLVETDKVSLIAGLPVMVEGYTTSTGGAGSAFGSFGSVGGSLDLAVLTGGVSRFVISAGGSYGDFLTGGDGTEGGTSAMDVGIEQSFNIGGGSLLILGVGTSFVEDADETTWLFELCFLFPKPR